MTMLSAEEKRVRKTLIQEFVLKDKGTTYGELVEKSKLDMNPHNKKFHSMLGNISRYEVENNRGMLSVMVGLKAKKIDRHQELFMPGDGIFSLAIELGVLSAHENSKLWVCKEQERVIKYWKDHGYSE